MRESILTIPVNEAFEARRGCPVCNMRNTVEAHICEYIMGAAMMEPDIRMETNALGFCHTHLNSLLRQNNRLSLALMLNTRLSTLREEIFEKKSALFSQKERAKKCAEAEQSCFVCSKINHGIDHTLKTVFTMFKNDEDFRKLYSEQEYICIPHYNLLMNSAQSALKKDDLKRFNNATDALIENYIKSLNQDVNDFCDSYDYRNKDKKNSEQVRMSIERAIEFLTSRKPEGKC